MDNKATFSTSYVEVSIEEAERMLQLQAELLEESFQNMYHPENKVREKFLI